MNGFTRILAGASLAFCLLVIPFTVGAESRDPHRIGFSEDDTDGNDGVAEYGMIQLTDLETVAGRQHLDQETIQFLEANLWLPESTAEYASVGIVAYTALCQGEGLVDSVNSIGVFCTPNAGFAAHEADQLLPMGTSPVDQLNPY